MREKTVCSSSLPRLATAAALDGNNWHEIHWEFDENQWKTDGKPMKSKGKTWKNHEKRWEKKHRLHANTSKSSENSEKSMEIVAPPVAPGASSPPNAAVCDPHGAGARRSRRSGLRAPGVAKRLGVSTFS